MELKRIFAIAVLAAATVAGCSDDSNGSKNKCGNGILEKNEICDGDEFAVTPSCPPGKVGDVSKIRCTATCTLDTSVCVDDNAGSGGGEGGGSEGEGGGGVEKCRDFVPYCEGATLVKACNAENGELTREVCTGSTPVCSAEKVSCIEEPSAPVADGFSCLPDNILQVCIDGECATEDCKLRGRFCVETNENGFRDADCVSNDIYSCEGNKVMVTDSRGKSEVINCTQYASKCVIKDTEGKDADCEEVPFTCSDDRKSVVVGEYSYNCEDNAKLDGDAKKNIGCNPMKGCYEIWCSGDSLMTSLTDQDSVSVEEVYNCTTEYSQAKVCSDAAEDCVDTDLTCDTDSFPSTCVENGSHEKVISLTCQNNLKVYENCASKEWTCDEATGLCKNPDPCTDSAMKCSDDGKMEYICVDDTWLGAECRENELCSSETNQCEEMSKCGNGIVDEGEACDPKADKASIWYTCSTRWPSDDYEYLGEIGCGAADSKNACKLISDNCYKSTDRESQVDLITIQENKDLSNERLSHPDGMISKVTDEANDNGWMLNKWTTSGTPSEAIYAGVAGDASTSTKDLSALVSASVRFDVKRGNNGPKKLVVYLYDGSSKVAQSRVFDVSETYSNVVVPVKNVSKYKDFSFRILGYSAGNTDAFMTLNNISIWTHQEQ